MKTKYDLVEQEDLTSPGPWVIAGIVLASIALILCAFGAVVWMGG